MQEPNPMKGASWPETIGRDSRRSGVRYGDDENGSTLCIAVTETKVKSTIRR